MASTGTAQHGKPNVLVVVQLTASLLVTEIHLPQLLLKERMADYTAVQGLATLVAALVVVVEHLTWVVTPFQVHKTLHPTLVMEEMEQQVVFLLLQQLMLVAVVVDQVITGKYHNQ